MRIFITLILYSSIILGQFGKIEVKILDGQESFRIRSFVKSNIWTLLPSGKSKFKKGDMVDCFFQTFPNKILFS